MHWKLAIAHVLGFAALVPTLVMQWWHRRLGLTNAFALGDQRSADYNLVMVFFFYLGSAVFLALTCYTYSIRRSRRGLVVRLLVLAAYWTQFGWFLESYRG